MTSVMGFAYWTVAARFFSEEAVGYGSAAVSAMTLLGTIGMFGLGMVLIGELPRRSPRGGLVSAALLASGLGSLVLGLGFAVIAPHFSRHVGEVGGTLGRAALFAVGVALTGMTMVFDQATIGLLRGGLQLSRNLAFAIAKLLALPATAAILHDGFGVGITLSWVAGTSVSLLPVAIHLRITGASILPRPDWGVLRGLGRTAVAHNWLNLAIAVPASLIPVLVTIVVSPSANAAFYAAWTLSGFLYVIPTHLSTALFAAAAAEPQAIPHKLRFTLRLSLLIGVPGAVALGLGAHLTLGMFGADYAREAAVPLCLLVAGYVPSLPKIYYIAVCRAVGKVSRAATVLTIFTLVEVVAAAVGGSYHGLKGLSIALLVVFVIEGVATAPAVLRTAMGRTRMGRGRHRHGDSPGDPTASIEKVEEVRQSAVLEQHVESVLEQHLERERHHEICVNGPCSCTGTAVQGPSSAVPAPIPAVRDMDSPGPSMQAGIALEPDAPEEAQAVLSFEASHEVKGWP